MRKIVPSKKHLAYLLPIFFLTVFFAYQFSILPIDQQNRLMEGQDPERRKVYDAFCEAFGSDNEVVLTYTRESLLTDAGFKDLSLLTAKIEKMHGVSQVFSISQILAPFEKNKVEKYPHQVSSLLSKDGKTASLIIEIDRQATEKEKEDLFYELYALKSKKGSSQLHMAGLPLQKREVSSLIQKDLDLIIPLSAVILAACLLFIFKSWLSMIITMLVTGISLMWTLGIYSTFGLSLNTITSLLPPVIMVLSVVNTVHILQSWREQTAKKIPLPLRSSYALKEVFPACFFTTLTTSLGMGSLIINDIPAVQLFGIFASLGVWISFLFSFLLTPFFLPWIHGEPKREKAKSLPPWKRTLSFFSVHVEKHPKQILVLSLLLSFSLAPGIFQLKNNTDLLSFLKPQNTLRNDTDSIGKATGSTQTLEILWSAKDLHRLSSIQDYQSLHLFQQRLLSLPNVQGVNSLINRLYLPNHKGQWARFPQNQQELNYIFRHLNKEHLQQFLSSSGDQQRIQIRLAKMGTAQASELVSEIEKISNELFKDKYSIQPTGAFYQVIQDSNGLVSNLVHSFIIAFATVLLAIGVYFRSLSVVFISIIPNIQPIIWTLGLMGYLGVDLSTGTAMIASVSIGIVVDDTIHYLTRYFKEKKISPSKANRETITNTGQAMLTSSVVLALGFGIGIFGSFLPTMYFALLTALTMVSAALCDLLVLPACIKVFSLSGGKGHV